MAGISEIAIAGANYTKNRKEYNGIEHTTDLDMNQYDAFYRTPDPQIGRFWQIDPEVEALSSSSPYESMGNNPVAFVDPLGDFKTRFGAWWHRLWNGGENIGRNEFGEWYVAKSEVSEGEDGVMTVTSSKYYGKGRNQFSSAGEKWEADQNEQKLQEQWTQAGIRDPNLSPHQAGKNALNLGFGTVLPNIAIRPATIAANNAKAAKILRNIVSKIGKRISVQKQARHILGTAKPGGGFLNSIDDAQAVLDAVHSGQATFLGTSKAGHQVFRLNSVTGTNVNLGAGVSGQSTNVFMIKGTTSPSVVPTNPLWMP